MQHLWDSYYMFWRIFFSCTGYFNNYIGSCDELMDLIACEIFLHILKLPTQQKRKNFLDDSARRVYKAGRVHVWRILNLKPVCRWRYSPYKSIHVGISHSIWNLTFPVFILLCYFCILESIWFILLRNKT